MPGSKRKAKNGPPKPSKKARNDPPASTTIYTGPTLDTANRSNIDTTTVVLWKEGGITASGTAINPVFSFGDPSGCTDWSDYSSSYDEFRVLAVSFYYSPNSFASNGASNSYAPIYSVIDRDSSTALTTYAAAANYGSLAVHSLDRKWSRTWKMNGVREATYVNTQSPVTTGAFKFFSSGLSNVTFGRFLCVYRVQFRGRGI
jgi:hypothetical protein